MDRDSPGPLCRLRKNVHVSAGVLPSLHALQPAGALACMVGGQILARSPNDPEGAQFLTDCQRFLRDALTGQAKQGNERIENDVVQ